MWWSASHHWPGRISYLSGVHSGLRAVPVLPEIVAGLVTAAC
jgi:hypothetical protein